jgi:hypothetical protein
LDLEELKAKQAAVQKLGQDSINEQLRLEGEYRSLGKLITELEDSGTKIPVTVVEPTTEDTEDGEPTPAN